MQTIISVEQAIELHSSNTTRYFDCRFSLQDTSAGERSYASGHIPGAIFADLNSQLSQDVIPGKTGRHPLPQKDHWLSQIQAWGLQPDLQVIAYDDVGGAGAARLWWLLKWIGHEKVAVLNGGLQAWLNAGGKLSAEVIDYPASPLFDYSDLTALVKDMKSEVIVNELQTESRSFLLVDAREKRRYLGEVEPIDPIAGHIPGAICSPHSANLDKEGAFLSPEVLREKFHEVITDGRPVVSYCGSGVTACHNALAMVHAGMPIPFVYIGSWSEWINDPTRPVVTYNECNQ
jgi:thiosulfate/3-mercaptopyruvate sulfurtransferase